MPLSKSQKAELVEKLVQEIKEAKSVVFADYQGMTVKEVKALKTLLREAGVRLTVSKKTLIKIAAKNAGFEDEIARDVIEGPIAVAFSMEDEIAAARILNNFAKKNDKLKLRGALFEGKVLSVKDTKSLATLPSKEELIVKFLYVIKSPISGFHGVLNNTVTGFVRVLNAIKEKQEQTA